MISIHMHIDNDQYSISQVIGIVLTHKFIDDIKERIEKIYENEGFENRAPRPAGPSQATGYL